MNIYVYGLFEMYKYDSVQFFIIFLLINLMRDMNLCENFLYMYLHLLYDQSKSSYSA